MRDTLRDEVLNKEITRKQFLQYMSGIFIGLFGVSSLLSSLINFGSTSTKVATKPTIDSSDRFGTRKFGR